MSDIVKQAPQIATQFNYFDNEQFVVMQRICTMFASSELVPEKYRISEKNPKEKAIANCMIAVETAQRIGASPLMVMQNMDVIQGKPSWSSKFLIATINTCGRFGQLKYRFRTLGKVGKVEYLEAKWENGRKVTVKQTYDASDIDNIECVAYTTEKGSDEVLESSEITIKLAIQEGWYQKSGSKWPTMTKKMLMYRAASFWTNEHAPELSMGMKTVEEEKDIEDIPYEDISGIVRQEIDKHANKTEIKFDDPPPPTDAGTPPPAEGEGKEDNPAKPDWA